MGTELPIREWPNSQRVGWAVGTAHEDTARTVDNQQWLTVWGSHWHGRRLLFDTEAEANERRDALNERQGRGRPDHMYVVTRRVEWLSDLYWRILPSPVADEDYTHEAAIIS